MSDIGNVLIVAHGAHHSTYDIYNYYLSAMRDAEINVRGFQYHNALDYHFHAITSIEKGEKPDSITKALNGASRDLITDITMYQPNHVLVISGLALPPKIAAVTYNLRNVFIKPYSVGYMFTESPYEDEDQEKYFPYLDYALFNDLTSVVKYNHDGDLFIDYLPHSFYQKIHYAYRKVDRYVYDVLFCGTLYPNRVDAIDQLSLLGNKLKIIGKYTDNNHRLNNVDVDEGHVDNIQLSEIYRRTKIVLNIHREDHTHTAYSMNPRVREAIACGALVVTDVRPEIIDIFGDTLPMFTDESEIPIIIDRLLNNKDERHNRVLAAQERIRDHRYADRIQKTILPILKEVEAINGKVDGA